MDAATESQAARFEMMGSFQKLILALSILVIGALVVMIALALIAWVTSLLEQMERPASEPYVPAASEPRAEAAPAQAAIPAVAPQPAPAVQPIQAAPAQTPSGLDPAIVAVITAAITTVLAGRRFRIQQIRMAGSASASAWGQAGRQSIHASHAIERKMR